MPVSFSIKNAVLTLSTVFLTTIFCFSNIFPARSAGNAESSDAQIIEKLEAQLLQDPDTFSFKIHNQLRHLYLNRDEKKAFYHCDEIFKNSFMNDYVLAIMADWKLDNDPAGAITVLESNAQKYPEFLFITAACTLKAGELYRGLGDNDSARAKFESVKKLAGEGFETYKARAGALLSSFNRQMSSTPWMIPVLEIRYFPVTPDGGKIDIAVTSNVGATLADTRSKCDTLTKEIVNSLEEGSRFRAYKNPDARPSLDYRIVETLEVLEPMPRDPRKKDRPDYKKILERANLKEYIEKYGVKEVWLWAYHSKEVAPWESNMASPYGDVSNSDRDPNDLPIFSSTYTVYHYNYQRTASEAVENHMHQIEALMAHYAGCLWAVFTGKNGAWRCGNCHFPPNGKRDYDWANKEYAMTDIEDWLPESVGKQISINCDRWDADSLKWFIYWMQSLPGENNGLTYKGKTLSNWWVLVGDYDWVVNDKNWMAK